ncbi:MAG TPA: hypothetical protein DCF33_15200 [Saprospirales bacterium]|nr:hypothetical protein [Saprospirales bacterium]
MTFHYRIAILVWPLCLLSFYVKGQEKPELVLNAVGSGWGSNVIALSSDDRLVAIGYNDGLIKIRDARDQSLIRAIKTGGRVERIFFSSNTDTLLVETQDEGEPARLYLFNWLTDQYPDGQSLGKHRICGWAPERQRIYLLLEHKKSTFDYNYTYQLEQRDFGLIPVGKPISFVVNHTLNERGDIIQARVKSMAQSYSGNLLAMGFQYGWVAVANLDSMKIVLKRRCALEQIDDLNFSRNDRFLSARESASLFSYNYPTAIVWSVANDFESIYQNQPFGKKG